ncbi:MAG: hypothetical protein JXR59_01475 [Desulfuromonadaceae bacterium]|nr:hypothetical protein [Desulfuromonadaceae bacterium]
MLKLLYGSDFCLGAPSPHSSSFTDALNQDRLKAFERFVRCALERQVDLILIAGNLFASPAPDLHWVEPVRAAIRRLQDQRIVVRILPGICDPLRPKESLYRDPFFSPLIAGNEADRLSPGCLRVGSHSVFLYTFPWMAGGQSPLCHQLKRSCQDGVHLGLVASADAANDSSGGLPRPWLSHVQRWALDYVVFGGRHKWRQTDERGRLCCGCAGLPQVESFSGPQQGCCHSLELNGQQVRLDEVPLPGATFTSCTLNLEGASDVREMLGPILNQENYLSCVLTGSVDRPFELEMLTRELRGRCRGVEWSDQTLLGSSQVVVELEKQDTVLGVTLQAWRQKDFPEDVREAILRELLARFGAFERE